MRGLMLACGVGLMGLLLGACNQPGQTDSSLRQPAPPKPLAESLAREIAPVRKPPTVVYQAAKPFKAWTGSGAEVAPPDPAQETWRIYTERRSPLQRETPKWRPAPATETVALQMPAGSRHQCVLQPLVVKQDANDFGTELKGWSLQRNLLCSGDGWHSWQEYAHLLYVDAEGKREDRVRARVFLHEAQDAGAPHDYVVVVRTDEERRAATTGPPQILAGVAVDDD